MARESNFLLGHGERLTGAVEVPSGGGPKTAPYSFDQARSRLSRSLRGVAREITALPDEACPGGETVAVVTMHPRYISKSDYPKELLREVGLRSVGSRTRRVKPESWGVKKHPEEAAAEDIFVAGSRDSFRTWASKISSWSGEGVAAQQLSTIESIASFSPSEKLKFTDLEVGASEQLLEVVLHNGVVSESQSIGVAPKGEGEIIESFLGYAGRLGARPVLRYRRDIKGLTFIPVWATEELLESLATFSFVRVARSMPGLRPVQQVFRSVEITKPIQLPSTPPLDPSSRAVIFDGGIPKEVRSHLAPWVTLIEPDGIGPADDAGERHGLAVTSAFLFGHLKGDTAPQPFCRVDHVRVVDKSPNPDYLCLDILARIENHLDCHPGVYQLANISLGPRMAVDDDDVTLWTAALDDRLAGGKMLLTAAAGNDGILDSAAGLNRVQPPADGVNLLSVGASSTEASTAIRAEYSCSGPGRSPGVVKPDGLAFGGSSGEPFRVLNSGLESHETRGTSFAAPKALRACASVLAQTGGQLQPLAIRALSIHRAEQRKLSKIDAGWGLFETDHNRLITCEDFEALIAYQGTLPIGEHLRFLVPFPEEPLIGDVTLSGTLLIAPEVDPGNAGNYTRAGLDVTFRPHCEVYNVYRDGSSSVHPKAKPFFSQSKMYKLAEYQLREDAHKWEPCRKHLQKFRSTSLKKPCFDVFYHHREGLGPHSAPPPLAYAFIIGISAPKVKDLYNVIVREYQNVLVPLKPKIRLEITQRAV